MEADNSYLTGIERFRCQRNLSVPDRDWDFGQFSRSLTFIAAFIRTRPCAGSAGILPAKACAGTLGRAAPVLSLGYRVAGPSRLRRSWRAVGCPRSRREVAPERTPL